MTYTHVTRTPDMSLEEYDRAAPRWAPSRSTATSSTTSASRTAPSVVVDKWSSKDHADRFAATRLYPAFAAAGVRHADGQTIFGFDSTGRN